MKSKTIEEIFQGRKNNLDILRFLAASLVIFSHSFPLSLGNDYQEPFVLLTNGQSTFGSIAVYTFFIISGFLITMSFDKSKNFFQFLKSRVLRIFPGLVVVVCLSILILGPIFTTHPLINYFIDPKTYDYLKIISLKFWSDSLPGVFETNVHGGINGSLWTLYFEFLFYLVVGILGIMKLLKKPIVSLLFLFTVILLVFQYYPIDPRYIYLFAFYSAGMLIYLFRGYIKINMLFAIISIVMIFIFSYFGLFQISFVIFGSYLIMYLAFSKVAIFSGFAKYGDFSYGMYIYAYPIQQSITYLLNNDVSPYINFLIAFPITFILAFLSWHLVEKPTLKYKNYQLKLLKKFKSIREA